MDVVQDQRTAVRWVRIQLRGMVAGALLASGMTALAAPPQQRAAILLPPMKLEPHEIPAVARGAIGDLPADSLGSTPRKRTATASAPAWLSGVDPNVIPASGTAPAREAKSPFGPPAKDLPPLTPTKLMGSSPKPGQPPTVDEASLDPNTPLRGMASNGAPVMAGPPAYRWYGYGSVTPGANNFAPTGQYPKASANWYGVTGATPGAFPVPVVNPYRPVPGSEPPEYVVVPPARPSVSHPLTTSTPLPGVPAMPPITAGGTGALPPLPQPVGVPAMPAVSPATTSISSITAPVMGLPVKASKPIEAKETLPAAAPEPLPPALSPSVPLPPPDLFRQPGAKASQPETARGQMPDDEYTVTTISLIQELCRGRAAGVDVRWTASRKLTVSFEARSQSEATALVKAISSRPELTELAVEFQVIVK